MIKIMPILLMLPSLCFSTVNFGQPKKERSKVLFPEVTFEIQTASGSHLTEEIEAVANSDLLSLRTIHYKYLNKGLGFEGDVLLKFTIVKSGEVTKIDIVRSSTGNAEFDKAIKNKVAAWKWDVKNSSATATILFKFATLFPMYYKALSMRNRAYIIDGARQASDINRIVIYQLIRMLAIRNKYLGREPLDEPVTVIFKFEITASGEATNVEILVDTAEHSEFEEAIKSDVAAHWKWKPIESGNTTVTVFYNFYE